MSDNKQDASNNTIPTNAISSKNNKKKLNASHFVNLLKKPFISLVCLPITVFSFYQTFIASPLYESRVKLIIQQPDSRATMDASMALLSGFGVSTPATKDANLVSTYIYSEDMLDALNVDNQFLSHFSNTQYDYFSRLTHAPSIETLYGYYESIIEVEIDDEAETINIHAKAFTPEYAQTLTKEITKKAEWYINKIGHELAKSQLSFIQGEHDRIEKTLFEAKKQLQSFQDKYQLLDPEAEGMALQQITYKFEAQLAEKNTALKALRAIMNENAPQVAAIKNEINALQAQLHNERVRLSDNNQDAAPTLSVGSMLSTYSELKIKLELALQAYTSSQISLEKSRIEAYRQLKYLVTVEAPTLPQDNKYPDSLYNITLFSLLLLMLYWIGRIVIATINELK